MRKSCLIIIFLLFVFGAFAQQAGTINRPKLVVGIVVDQMRWDYLYRYYDRFGSGGFKRLMNDGFNCQNAMINYVPSFTAPGHACAYTGSVPSIHGIVANDWIDNLTNKEVYCAGDKTVMPIAGSMKAGQMSPRNLLVTTITDELRLATNMRSRVYGISIKDRGAIMPAGHLANGAYWFDDSTGNFMTSNYYGNALPSWLVKFNNRRWADTLIREEWNTMYPIATYTESLSDNNPYEGTLKGEHAPVFPHKVSSPLSKGYNRLRFLPGGNSIVFKAAKACVRGEGLGQGSSTDFLCVSFSSTDYTGHMFTSNSIEAEDMYLRLDVELASFLSYLDRKVGEGNYLIFLTADHGAAHNATFMQDRNIPAGNAGETELLTELNQYLYKHYKGKAKVKALTNYQLYIDEDSVKSTVYPVLKQEVINWLKKQPGIAFAVDMEENTQNNLPEPVNTMIANGYYAKRSGCIQIIPEPGWYGESFKTGTTHGTWNPYDTHIPLLWYGWGIPAGEQYEPVNLTDIAATLAGLLHIQMPNGCIGKPVKGILK